MKPFHKR